MFFLFVQGNHIRQAPTDSQQLVSPPPNVFAGVDLPFPLCNELWENSCNTLADIQKSSRLSINNQLVFSVNL